MTTRTQPTNFQTLAIVLVVAVELCFLRAALASCWFDEAAVTNRVMNVDAGLMALRVFLDCRLDYGHPIGPVLPIAKAVVLLVVLPPFGPGLLNVSPSALLALTKKAVCHLRMPIELRAR